MDIVELKELISSIKERLQLALTISIFFPTFLAVYFEAVKASPEEIRHNVLNWSSLIVLYLLSYLIFDGWKSNQMRSNVLRGLNRLILGGIGLFVIPILELISIANSSTAPIWILWVNLVSFIVSLNALP